MFGGNRIIRDGIDSSLVCFYAMFLSVNCLCTMFGANLHCLVSLSCTYVCFERVHSLVALAPFHVEFSFAELSIYPYQMRDTLWSVSYPPFVTSPTPHKSMFPIRFSVEFLFLLFCPFFPGFFFASCCFACYSLLLILLLFHLGSPCQKALSFFPLSQMTDVFSCVTAPLCLLL